MQEGDGVKIARVFPRRTSMSPTDKDAYFGFPDLFTPQYDEVHISVTFTWDKIKADGLFREWSKHVKNVKIGGPALGDHGGDFTLGMYLKQGVTITSRGCPNNCGFCFVPKREGKIRELPIIPGNIIQDNNLTACSRSHIDKVFQMLKKQKRVVLQGGVESARVDDYFVDKLRGISLHEVWLAYDHPNADKPLEKAINKLSKYFKRDKIRCYVLIGYEGDNLEKAEVRLKNAWNIGTLPFAMRYRTSNTNWEDTYFYKDRKWNLLARQWTRPAIMKTMMKKIINTEGILV
jgi:hypothetical protein